jgi:hypothetical protein
MRCIYCGLARLIGRHNGRLGHLFIPRKAVYA